jgi:hypothetical protein
LSGLGASLTTPILTHKTSMIEEEDFKPRYLNVSERVFKKILSTSIENGDKLIPFLNTNERLDFVSQMAEVINDFYF